MRLNRILAGTRVAMLLESAPLANRTPIPHNSKLRMLTQSHALASGTKLQRRSAP